MNKFITKLAVLAMGAASVMGVSSSDIGSIKASAVAGETVATFNSKTLIGTENSYKAYTNSEWILTYGGSGYGSGGTNNTRASSCILGTTYARYAGDTGVSTTQTRTFAAASAKALANVGTITISFDSYSINTGDGVAYLLYSADDTNYSTIALTSLDFTQGQVIATAVGSNNLTDNSTVYSYSFNTIESAYYAVLFTGGATGNFRFDNLEITYIEGEVAGRTSEQIASDFYRELLADEASLTLENGEQKIANRERLYNNLSTEVQDILNGGTYYDEQNGIKYEYSVVIQRMKDNLDALVEAANQAAAEAVVQQIDAIGEITDYSKAETVRAARVAYDLLTDAQKALVTNLATLVAAELELENYAPAAGEFVYGTNYGQTLDTYTSLTDRAITIDIVPLGDQATNASRLSTNHMRLYVDYTATFTADSTQAKGIVQIKAEFMRSDDIKPFTTVNCWNPAPTSVTSDESGGVHTATLTFASTSTAVYTATVQTRVKSFTVSYEKADSSMSAELAALIQDVTNADTCSDYELAETYRTAYNRLSEDEQATFDKTLIKDQDGNGAEVSVTCGDKLAYMEMMLASGGRETPSNVATDNIKEKTPISLIILVAVLGLSAVAVYQFINKKKQQA